MLTWKEPLEVLQSCLEEAAGNGIPGLSAAAAIGGEIVWTGTAGFADLQDRRPVTPDMAFGIGSITKPFVATIIYQMVEEGRLGLDDSPGSILGDVTNRIANPDATVAQLLSHSTGIPNWEWEPEWIKEGRGANIDVRRIWEKAETLPYIFDRPPIALAADEGDYSNTNYILLGLMIEKITGRDFVEGLVQRILRPLSLKHTYLEGFMPPTGATAPRRYHWATEAFRSDAGIAPAFVEVQSNLIDVTASNLSVEWTAGGLVATASDLARFGSALQGGMLLSARASAQMQTWDVLIKERQFGHGLYREQLSDRRAVIGHDGGVLGFSSTMFWPEGSNMVVAVLTNAGMMHSGAVPVSVHSLTRQSKFIEALHALAGDVSAAE